MLKQKTFKMKKKAQEDSIFIFDISVANGRKIFHSKNIVDFLSCHRESKINAICKNIEQFYSILSIR